MWELSALSLLPVCSKNHIWIFSMNCCQIEIQGWKIGTCWVLMTLFFSLYLNFWWPKVLRKTHTDFSNENWTLHWHPGKGMGIAASSADYQKCHPSFQPGKWKKKPIPMFRYISACHFGIHPLFRAFIYKDRTCWSLTCAMWEPRVAFWLFNTIDRTLQIQNEPL